MDTNNRSNKIRTAIDLLKNSMEKCVMCPRRCGVNRAGGKAGYCRAPLNPVIYSYIAHRGEEPALSGTKGSGTIFFTHCNMKCVYCQNYIFSQLDNGEMVSIERLAAIMLEMQKKGCHNINLVSPTHFVPQIIAALGQATERGLAIPIVYNTSGYDSLETIKMLDGIIDVYMPDMRYSDNKNAAAYSDAPDYVEHNRRCLKEMHRQAGDLELNGKGIAIKGLIVRLLVLPGGISGTVESLRFIKEEISKNTYISVMSQYYPTFKSYNFKELSRGITKEEYQNVVDEAHRLELNNGWIQEMPEPADTKFMGTNITPKPGKEK